MYSYCITVLQYEYVERADLDQLNLILNVLVTPSKEDFDAIINDKVPHHSSLATASCLARRTRHAPPRRLFAAHSVC